MNYQKKYIKYKNKYLNLKKNMLQRGSGLTDNIPPELFDHISSNIIKREVILIKTELNIPESELNIEYFKKIYPKYNIDMIKRDNICFSDNNPSEYYKYYNGDPQEAVKNDLSQHIADNLSEAIKQNANERFMATGIFTMLYELKNDKELKIINATGDGQCFFHADAPF